MVIEIIVGYNTSKLATPEKTRGPNYWFKLTSKVDLYNVGNEGNKVVEKWSLINQWAVESLGSANHITKSLSENIKITNIKVIKKWGKKQHSKSKDNSKKWNKTKKIRKIKVNFRNKNETKYEANKGRYHGTSLMAFIFYNRKLFGIMSYDRWYFFKVLLQIFFLYLL